MVIKQQLLIDTLEQPFEMGQYIKFVTELFNSIKTNTHIQTNEKVWGEYREHIKSYTKIGRYIDDNNKKIDIWAVELCSEGSVERARSLQRNFISKLLTADNSHAGIIAFYVKDAVTWRLSFVKLDREFSPKGIQIETTPAKRYSYLVGIGEKSHTAQEQLLPIFQNEKENPTLEGIEEAFSIETVTKEFFAKYKEKYLQLKEYLDKNNDFVQTAEQYNFTTEQFAKKLMGQLAFLYFLQKKGWLGVSVAPKTLTEKQYKDIFFRQKGDARQVFSEHYEQQPNGSYKRTKIVDLEKDKYKADLFAGCFVGVEGVYTPWGSGDKNFIRRIFENCMARTKEYNFFDEYLEPLFYNALNNPRGKNCYFPAFNSKIPFLNGGLFEPLFDNWEEKHFDIPNEIFSNAHIKKKTEADGILDIFERFNFTINEDEPLEREVAVDPEMLGKIFENLLDVKDRKSKGAFYTPREIVHYMCQESIINHLVNEVGVPYDDMKQFVLYGEVITSQDNSKKTKEGEQERAISKEVFERIESIDKALSDVRVADPAVGSGAFPLGMLNEIVKLRTNITQYMINTVPDQYPGQKDLLRINRHPYKLKWETIQNCIFAVDIEPSAVDITKLRLWLSLIVDQEIDELNESPHALPNLDCNIMCGNSLIEEFEGIKLFDEKLLNQIDDKINKQNCSISTSQLSLDTIEQQAELTNMFENLFGLQQELFGEDDPERKMDIKNRIDSNLEAVIEYQLRYINKNEEAFKKYKKALKDGEKPYFLWKLEFARVFKEKSGFDIVIGNPPYIEFKKMDAKFKKELESKYICAKGKYDVYVVFIEWAHKVLNGNGKLCFINPIMFMKRDYGKEIRKFIANNYRIHQIIDFADKQIFESATTYTGVFLMSKPYRLDYQFKYLTIANEKLKLSSRNLDIENLVAKEELTETHINSTNLREVAWNFNNNKDKVILDKIKSQSILLDNLTRCIFQGIASGKDEVFYVNETIIQQHKLEKELLHKIYKGKDISCYEEEWSGTYVIYPYNQEKVIEEDVLQERYPNTYTYLKENRDKLKGRTYFDKSSKLWYELWNQRKQSYFCEPYKICTAEINKSNSFILDRNAMYGNTKIYTILLNEDKEEAYYYILALLNSNLLTYFYKNISVPKAGGFYAYKTQFLKQIPIKIAVQDKYLKLVELSKELSKKLQLDKLNELNTLVYDIYEIHCNDRPYIDMKAKS